MDKNVLLKCLSTGKSLIESNAAFFAKKTDSKRFNEGKKLERYFVGVSRAPDGNAVIEFQVPSRSEKGVMRHCFIDIIPKNTNLFTLAQTTKRLADRVKVLKDADVRCFCTCPDFNWNGMKYMMKHQYDSLSADHHSDNEEDDHGEDIAPKVRTPALCSHLIAALGGILTNASSIMKQVRTAPPVETTEPKPQEPAEPDHPIVGKANSEELSNEIVEEHNKARNEAIDLFTTGGGGIKTEDTQKALDALANNIEPTEEDTETTEEVEDPGYGLVGKANSEEQANRLIDYDEEAALPMFDVPLDEEDDEVSVDDEIIAEEPEEPMELP